MTEITVTIDIDFSDLAGHKLDFDILNEETGEIIIFAGRKIRETQIKKLEENIIRVECGDKHHCVSHRIAVIQNFLITRKIPGL